MTLRSMTRLASRAGLFSLSAFLIASASLGDPSPASAETLAISATGLVRHCPCGAVPNDLNEEEKGVFKGDTPNGRYFVPVVFPVTTGQNVCSFSMVYEDINAKDSITARLFRKNYISGGNPFNNPVVVASVASAAGTPATVRIATDTTITQPAINVTRSFYYIEVDIVTTNLNVLGFKIEYKPTC